MRTVEWRSAAGPYVWVTDTIDEDGTLIRRVVRWYDGFVPAK